MGAVLDRLDDAIRNLVGRLDRSTALAVGLLLLVAAILLVPGQQSLPLTDRDEARFVLASKQMLESGDFIEPRNLDAPRWKKPIGIYWLQAGAAAMSSRGSEAPLWVWRLPSSLGILAASLLTLWALRPLIGPAPAAIAGLVVASTVVTAIEGHIAKTDAALLAAVVLAQGALIRAIERPPELGFQWPHALFWTALAAGVLIKGPIIVLVVGGTLIWLTVAELSFDDLRRTKPWPGLVLLVFLTLPWFLAIGLATDWAFYVESVGRDLLGKVDSAAEGHTGPPGYYLMTVWLTFWPWTPLALLALPFAWRNRSTEAMRLIFGWILPTWVVFALATTKLPHYVMPVLPAIGALIGLWLSKHGKGPRSILCWVAAGLFLVGGLVLVALTAGAPIWFEGKPESFSLFAGLFGLVIVVTGASAIARSRPHAAAVLGLLSLLILVPALLRTTLPALDILFLSPRIAAIDAQYDACADRPVIATGYEELSVAVLSGTDTLLVSPMEAGAALASGEPGDRVFVLLDGREKAVEAAAGTPLMHMESVRGVNYNKGSEVIEIGLFARMGDATLAACTKE